MSSPPAVAGRVSFVALCAAVIATAFQKFGTVWFQGMPLQVSDVAVLVAALAWLWQVAGARDLQWSPFYVPFALYLGAALLSLIGHPHPLAGALKTIGIGSLIAVVVVAERTLDRPERWARLCDVWTGAAAVAGTCAVLGVVAFYAGWRDNPMVGHFGSLPILPIPRIEGPFRNSNMLADYLGVTLCLLWARRRDHSPRKLLLLALPVVGALPFTFSLQLGAIALAAAILVVLQKPAPAWLRPVVVAGGLGAFLAATLLAVVVVVAPGQGDFPLGAVDVKLVESGRIASWRASLGTYAQHPLFGKGVGEYVAQFHHEYAAQGLGPDRITDFDIDAHNAYIGLLAQMGPLAVLAFAWILVVLLRRVAAAPAGVREPLAAGLLGIVAFGNLYGGFEDARHAWLFFGICAAAAAAAPGARPSQSLRK
jgi:O-antigen ligase